MALQDVQHCTMCMDLLDIDCLIIEDTGTRGRFHNRETRKRLPIDGYLVYLGEYVG